ncbi:MAG: hypothetical protein CSA68_09365 [Rhodobacterales bacterium]|nr:MAG: hypothetical protein CSA68_09365 [Rhodobacterales bacterium]
MMIKFKSSTTRPKAGKHTARTSWQPIYDFYRHEQGTMLPFAMAIIILMILMGGMAIDVMRAETQRTQIQYTQDRAVLAAASMKQQEEAQDIFDSYFEKDGIPEFTPRAVVEEGLNFRRVFAIYDEDNIPTIPTGFIDELGIEYFSTPAASAAEDQIGKVEISLVLDVSGSMGGISQSGQSKLRDLQDAAKDFVDTLLLDRDEDDDTYSISIVPYSTQVTAGADLLSHYNVTNEHSYSNCVDFEAADFERTDIDPVNDLLQRTGHFTPWDWWDLGVMQAEWEDHPCISDTDIDGDNHEIARKIIPVSDDADALKDYIDSLEAGGWTSTDVGVKWGTALLDPSARPVITDMVDDELVDTKFTGRPFDYNEEHVLKVMVVMSDGQNTNQYFLDDSVSSGNSPVWYKYTGNKHKFWIYNSDRNKYKKLFFNSDSEFLSNKGWKNNPGNNTARLTWPELWRLAAMGFVSHDLFDRADIDGGGEWSNSGWDDYYSIIYTGEKDQRMFDICNAAKAQGILLYTIGFEVEDANAVKLTSCATTPAHFFRVEGVEISEAFASIAAQLIDLRLIQ